MAIEALRPLALCLLWAASSLVASAQTFTTLVNFNGANGSRPVAGTLTVDHDGNLWGVTQFGGTNNLGTVYKMTSTGTLTTVYNFGSTPGDSKEPFCPPVLGADGNFYGLTTGGFLENGGIAYQLTPSGALTVLHAFESSYGGYANQPTSPLTQGMDGNFYGVTYDYGYGTVFKITPDGTFTNLHTFSGPDGRGPWGGLVQGPDGYFYGTTAFGGAYDVGGESGGTIFKVSSSGDFASLYSFDFPGGSEGTPPIMAKDGNFYGASGSGTSDHGTIYKMAPDGTVSTLHSFTVSEGISPAGPLMQASDGNFYGTTAAGGQYGLGTVFQMTPSGTFTVLHNFTSLDGTDGASGLVQHPNGQLYGFQLNGGLYGYGTVYTITLGGPVVNLSPSSLSFGNQLLGNASASQTVTLTNTGLPNLTISTVTIAGTNASDFATSADTCTGATVTPNSTCTVTVTFTPTATGTRTGSITITDNASDSPQIVSLTGTGINPAASVSPGSRSFGSQALGTTSVAKTVTLTSTGTTSLNISSITFTGTNASDFAETNDCPASMAPGVKCNISVMFTPSILGGETGTLLVTDDASNSPQTASLSGKGAALAVLSPTAASFGKQAVNMTSSAKTVTLTNNQDSALGISNITTSGDFAQTNNCGSSIPGNGKCTISVTFTPSIIGAESGTLTVTDDASNSPQTASLSGTGVVPVTLSPASPSFGKQAVNMTSAAKTITLTNNQDSVLGISNITTSGDFAQTNTCGSSVPGNGKCTISVTFTPSIIGAESGTLTVTDDASSSPQTASLSGTGVVPVALSPASPSFGNQAENTTSTVKTITLTNNQDSALGISNIATSGDFAQTNTCGSSVPGNGQCTISVTFTPSIIGAELGTLTVTDDAPNSPQTASLSGTGIVQAKVSPTSMTLAAETVGTTSPAKIVTLTNNLSTALTIGSITFIGDDPGDFAQTNTCGGSLPAMSQCTISVTFTPTATGSRTATITVNDSANNSPQAVLLTGKGK